MAYRCTCGGAHVSMHRTVEDILKARVDMNKDLGLEKVAIGRKNVVWLVVSHAMFLNSFKMIGMLPYKY